MTRRNYGLRPHLVGTPRIAVAGAVSTAARPKLPQFIVLRLLAAVGIPTGLFLILSELLAP